MVELNKTLSFPVVLLITINSIIGSGLFFLPALGARVAGPASLISWLILSVIVIFVAMTLAELAGMFPKVGGIYEYCKQAYGRFPSFIVGWMAWLVGNITGAMLIVAAIRYLIPGNTGVIFLGPVGIHTQAIKLIFCIFCVIAFNYLTYRGMKTSASMLVGFSFATMGIVLILAIPALFKFDINNFIPFFAHLTEAAEGGVVSSVFSSGYEAFFAILIAVFLLYETFFGHESVLFLSAEMKDPKKTIPKALIVGTILVIILTLLLIISAFGAMSWSAFAAAGLEGSGTTPFNEFGLLLFGPIGGKLIMIGTFIAILGAAAGWVVTGPRLILALAEDKLFLSHFNNIHPKYGTPHKAIFFQALATIIFILIAFTSEAGYEQLLHLLLPLVLIMLTMVLTTLIVLRIKMPHAERPFKMPGGIFTTVILSLFHCFLIIVWLANDPGAWPTLKLCLSFIAIGLPLYFLVEVYYDPRAISTMHDITAHFSLFTEKINMPRAVKKEIFQLLGNLEGKKVIEYGAGVGTFTVDLAQHVGPMGRVYTIDLSKKNLKIVQTRLNQALWKTRDQPCAKVHLIHDDQQIYRMHPLIHSTDVILSVGMLGYVQDINQVLNDMYKILPYGGQICFVEYGDFFNIIPNVEWLSHNEIIEKIFRKAGFSVRVIRRKGLFWNYIYVYGIKYERDIAYI